MQKYSSSPAEMINSIWRNRQLIGVLVRREVLGRYQASVMGIAWSFLNPLLMLIIYTFVFSVVFKARWSGGSDSKIEFALLLFAGLIFFSLFSECFTKAPSLIVSNINYVKKVVFPLEILPVISLGAALFHFIVSFCVWVGVYLVFFGLPKVEILLLPVIVIPFIFLIMGFTWALASLGVYFRDLPQVTAIITSLLMFLSPIFYPASALPDSYQVLFLINPISPVIEWGRDVIFWGKFPDFNLIFIYFVFSFFFAWLGFFWFQRTRKGFADVL